MPNQEEIPLQERRTRYFRSIFDKYDRNQDGFLNLRELNDVIQSREYDNDIPDYVVERIHQLADKNGDRMIDFNEFVDMIQHPALQHVFGHYITRYVQLVVPKRRTIGGTTVPDGLYEDEYSCYPPAVGMIIVSIIEIIFFCIDEIVETDSTNSATGPVAELFIYDPHKRQEVWRFFTYMFVHVG